MECKKCSVVIPSQFEYVLSQNVCPKCGNKLMPDVAMKVYIDLKTRLQEIEFVMDKTIVCERVAMFLITNYDVAPLGQSKPTPTIPAQVQAKPLQTAAEKAEANAADVAKFKAQLAAIANDIDNDLTPDEIRAEEAARAEDLAAAREMDIDIDVDADEELVTGRVDNDRLQRLKKLAATSQMSKTGQVGMIKRT